MYTRPYSPRTEPPDIPRNYGGTTLTREEESPPSEEVFSDMGAPVCCETPKEEERAPSAKQEAGCEEQAKIPLPDSFATGDLLLLAVAALLTQSDSSDNELLMILLLLLLLN